MIRFIIYILITFSLVLSGCEARETLPATIPEFDSAMDVAAGLMESRPDSTLAILRNIDADRIEAPEQKARLGLLLSMALDKNYIDVAEFDILQPAIDYYTDHGTPDEQLRTFYYQGRIFQNRGEKVKALETLSNGAGLAPLVGDSLSLARTYVAMGVLYKDLYDIDDYTDCYLAAGSIYHDLSEPQGEDDCLLNALNGAILLGNKAVADSLMSVCQSMDTDNDDEDDSLSRWLDGYRLAYALNFSTGEELVATVDSLDYPTGLDVNDLLNLAAAHHRLGRLSEARELLESVANSNINYDTLKFEAIAVGVYKGLGAYREALAAHEDYNRRLEAVNSSKFTRQLSSLVEKHRLEMDLRQSEERKSRMVRACVSGLLVLLLIILVLSLLARSRRIQKELAIQSKIARVAENSRLRLEAENLTSRLDTLELEAERLKSLLDTQKELSPEVREAIRVRIELLNSLLAGYISSSEKHSPDRYDDLVSGLTANPEEFMDSNRLAFEASHPRFVQYFRQHGLTLDEINYVCLYAIGLRGKEVGNYMKKRSHVNMSTAIRKKLGLDTHATNLGIYVRKLLSSQDSRE